MPMQAVSRQHEATAGASGEMTANKLWISGWLTQSILIALSIAALCLGREQAAITCLVGSMVIGAIRQIESDRRDHEAKHGGGGV